MSSVKCNECGMVNWVTAEVCKRCHTPLRTPTDIDGTRNPSESDVTAVTYEVDASADNGSKKRPSHRWKWILIAAVVGLVLITSAISLAKRVLKPSTPRYADLIQTSQQYRKTLNILINRQNDSRTSNYPEAEMKGVNVTPTATLLPETIMLYHAGFLVFHQIGSDDAATNIAFLMGPFTIEPKSKEIESQWRLLDRRMAIGDSSTNVSREWWVVPIGEREFGQVTESRQNHDFGSSTDYVDIEFSWKWKPNAAGQALDKSDPSCTPPENIIGVGNWSPADSARMAVRDSHQVYAGYAKLMRKDDGSFSVWDVWFADSPNQHWPTDRDNSDHKRHNMDLPGF